MHAPNLARDPGQVQDKRSPAASHNPLMLIWNIPATQNVKCSVYETLDIFHARGGVGGGVLCQNEGVTKD